ncbi:MAG: hypothetical protein U9Q23_05200 [Candidatus Bipolaricaulota bacterium]|nr:hypothetical protein [Candidatus Bipolaricaulota bacterium]
MLKLGYWLMTVAGALLGGYIAYLLIHVLVTTAGLHPFFKALILTGVAGVLITIIGLIRERRKEGKDAEGLHSHAFSGA